MVRRRPPRLPPFARSAAPRSSGRSVLIAGTVSAISPAVMAAPTAPGPTRRPLVALLLTGACAILVVLGLGRLPDQPTWLSLTLPARAVLHSNFTAQITLRKPHTGFVGFELLWHDRQRAYQGRLPAPPVQRVHPGQADYEFTIPVTPVPGLRFVSGLVFLSPTGLWEDRTAVAVTGYYQPLTTPTDTNGVPWPRRTTHAHFPRSPEFYPPPSRTARTLTAALFMAAAASMALVLVTTRRHRSRSASGEPAGGVVLLIVIQLACGAWEQLEIGERLANRVREAMQVHGVYKERHTAQQPLTGLALAAGSACMWALLRSRMPGTLRTTAAGCAAYGAIAVLSAISLHAVDVLSLVRLGPFPAVQALELGAAATALLGTLLVLLSSLRRHPA